jgi:hypothetical protein
MLQRITGLFDRGTRTQTVGAVKLLPDSFQLIGAYQTRLSLIRANAKRVLMGLFLRAMGHSMQLCHLMNRRETITILAQ